jgi:preprotein translocase subunit SecA
MSFLNSVLKTFVGDKSQKDVKKMQPLVNEIRSFEAKLEGLSHDELRAKTAQFKAKIKEDRKSLDDQIEALKEEVTASTDIDKNEDIYAEIDKLKEEAYKVSEDTLNEILPEAFAVVKETAKRFANNTTLKVSASEYDRELSGDNDYVSLEGDNAVWKNSWDAAGKEVTWDMIHYDVQLIGGIALHQGKIAEMQTKVKP